MPIFGALWCLMQKAQPLVFLLSQRFKEAGVSYRRTRGELCDCRSMLCLAFLTSESSMSII